MRRQRPLSVSRTPNRPPTDIDAGEFEVCEPRIALSATAASAWWQSMVGDASSDPMTDGGESVSASGEASATSTDTPPTSPIAVDLFSQAKQLRQTTGLSGAGQTAVVIDTGIAPDHVTLGGENRFGPGGRVVGGYDFAENDDVPYDDGPAGFHGTHVASLLGGDDGSPDGDGHQGIAPEVDLVSLRVFDDHGRSDLQWIESALQWVHDNRDSFDSPITTVNLSVGAGLDAASAAEAASVLSDELQQLRDDGILVFAAAGNFYDGSGDAAAVYPASDPNVLAVSSIDGDGLLSDFSQRPDGALAAVGRDVAGAVPEHVFGWDGNIDDVASLDGSSMATPQVAGASILIREALTEAGLPASPDDVLHALAMGTTTQTDAESGSTFSTIDLRGSLQWIADSLPGDAAANNNAASIDLDFSGNSINELDLSRLDGLRPDADGVYRLDGGDGGDALTIRGGEANERFILRAGATETSEIMIGDVKVELTGFENLRVEGGDGDRISLFDTRGNDTLRTAGDVTTLDGVGYEIEVQGIRQIYVHATAGGSDRAFLSDTAGDDTLIIRPEFTSMRSGVDGDHFRLAFGFEDVSVASSSGGNDRVEIYDSVGDDTLYLSPGRSVLAGDGYRVSATGFDQTVAVASNPGNDSLGGRDTVRVYLDDPADLSVGSGANGSVDWIGTGDGDSVRARGFEKQQAYVDYQPIDLAEWVERRRANQSGDGSTTA